MNANQSRHALLCSSLLLGTAAFGQAQDEFSEQESSKITEELTVFKQTHDTGLYPGQQVRIDTRALANINLANVEDSLTYQPNLIVRRRYIGDLNSTLGMRGANMFQTTRTMVFADGLPLHYFLQTQFAGAPRWSLVSPGEIASVDVSYGPFSAEYSGNAMGGVVNINSRRPQGREFSLDLSAFTQTFSYLGTDDDYPGYQAIATYGDRFEDFSLFASYTKLNNISQPLTYSASQPLTDAAGATAVSGGISGRDTRGNSVIYYGDQESEEANTDLGKLVLAHSGAQINSQLTLAFEKRRRDGLAPNNYLQNNYLQNNYLQNNYSQDNSQPFWRGLASLDGVGFEVDPEDFYLRDQDRSTFLAGIGVEGPVFGSPWDFSLHASHFDISKDRDVESTGTFADPDYDGGASLTDFGDSGWQTLDLKFSRQINFGPARLDILSGYHFDDYQLSIKSYSSDFLSKQKQALTNASGGNTRTQALFVQSNVLFNSGWEIALGGRYEQWRSTDDYPQSTDSTRRRQDSQFSPKFSLAYQINSAWQTRYSVARAYRFPIVEELFQNERRTSGLSLADSNLQPEKGLHHNWLLAYGQNSTTLSLNYFDERVNDVIFTQTQISPRVRTFLAVDEVHTRGLELSVRQGDLLGSGLGINANITWLDAKTVKNSPNPAAEGKQFPRMPKWRAKLMLDKDFKQNLRLSLGLRYASNSFGQIDNSDTQDEVFGAHDDYLFINAKIRFEVHSKLSLNLGVDNLNNERAFVFSPWPGRTLFMGLRYQEY